ncbi:MAG: N,N-dimethylformamidase beta subunit family domain-containing protein, partial [Planctomycetota bacterium]
MAAYRAFHAFDGHRAGPLKVLLGVVGLCVTAALAADGAMAGTPGEPANVIVAENRHKGTRDWILRNPKVPGAKRYFGDVRSPRIEGYGSRISVRAGEQIEFFVSTDPVSEFSIHIYRLGYYNGDGGRFMTTLGPFEGKAQPVPARDGKRHRLRECRWEACTKLTVPADWVSGVYVGRLKAKLKAAESYVIFIVRDDRKADFMFQCSTNTWVIYNRWPHRDSGYEDEEKPWPDGRTAYTSYDRPFGKNYMWATEPLTTGTGEFLCWEFPLAYWMEKEGYDVTYVTNVDTHADIPGLRRVKGFLSVGHDEYYTRRM